MKNNFSLATVEKNSIGGWTVRYPLHNESNRGVWFGEAHFDHNRMSEALMLAHEKEAAFFMPHDIDGGN